MQRHRHHRGAHINPAAGIGQWQAAKEKQTPGESNSKTINTCRGNRPVHLSRVPHRRHIHSTQQRDRHPADAFRTRHIRVAVLPQCPQHAMVESGTGTDSTYPNRVFRPMADGRPRRWTHHAHRSRLGRLLRDGMVDGVVGMETHSRAYR